LAGHVEQQVFSDLTFKTQQRSFHVLGYAADPSILNNSATMAISGDAAAAFQNGNAMIGDVKPTRAAVRAMKRKRKGKGAVGEFEEEDEEEDEVPAEGAEPVDGEMEVDGEAPKKKKKEKVQKEYVGPWAGWEGESLETVGPSIEEYEEQEEGGGAPLNRKERVKAVLDNGGKKEVGFGEEKSTFHGALFPSSLLV
jgi:pre-mRNA-processing factor 17